MKRKAAIRLGFFDRRYHTVLSSIITITIIASLVIFGSFLYKIYLFYTEKKEIEKLIFPLVLPFQKELEKQLITGIYTPLNTSYLTRVSSGKILRAAAYIEMSKWWSPFVNQGCVTVELDFSSLRWSKNPILVLHGTRSSSGAVSWYCTSFVDDTRILQKYIFPEKCRNFSPIHYAYDFLRIR